MWIPENADQLERLVAEGAVEETSILDCKAELPASGKELAKDVAAMTNDGGVLIYGVGEDESGRPTVLKPFSLEGAAEKLSSIIRSSLAEPPYFEIKTLSSSSDPERGYLIIIVPASPLAPHMVVVKGDNRFYGRAAKGNTPLTEGEVARLYQRRRQWEVDREDLLDSVVAQMAPPPQADLGYLFLCCRPVISSPSRLYELGERSAQRNKIYALVQEAIKSDLFSGSIEPQFGSGNMGPISAGWEVRSGLGGGQRMDTRLQVHFSGETRLFLGRAAERFRDSLALLEAGIAETTRLFLFFSGSLLKSIEFFGPADLGLAVTGIESATSLASLHSHAGFNTHFDQDTYRETLRTVSSQLDKDASSLARQLLLRLFHASGAVGHFDPFN